MFYVIRWKKIKKIIILLVAAILAIVVAYMGFSWYYPLKYIDVIDKNCEKYDLDPSLVCALIHAESKFDKSALSIKGASGLMQIVENTADWAADEIGMEGYSYDKIFEPEINIEIGCWLLNKLIEQFGDEYVAIAAYNAGSGNVSSWLQNDVYSEDGKSLDVIPYDETKNYINRVKFNRTIYDYILKFYGGTYDKKKQDSSTFGNVYGVIF